MSGTESFRPLRRFASGRSLVAALAAAAACAGWQPDSSAQKAEHVRVADSILGVRLGATLEEAREKLRGLRVSGGAGDGEDGEREGGRKEAWTLRKSDYKSIVYQTGAAGRVEWVTGFVRAGREIPFEKLGDPARAAVKTDQEVVWNVLRPEGNYRLIAKGANGRARVVHLLTLKPPPVP